MLQDQFHPNFPSPLSSWCTMKPFIKMLHDTSHHNTLWPLITMLHALSSQCSRNLFIAMFLDRVITMLDDPCHHNDPEFFSSHFSIVITIPHGPFLHNAARCLSSQCSMAFVITMLQDQFHYNTPSPLSSRCTMKPFFTMLHDTCHHNAPWPLSSQCSQALFITMFHENFHHIAP